MSLTDLPLSVLFMFFLWIFILIGIYPAWKRAAAKIRRLRQTEEDPGRWAEGTLSDGNRGMGWSDTGETLNDLEIIILRRLAQGGRRGLSLRKIRSELLLDRPMVKTAIGSLHERGMISAGLSPWRGLRFSLSSRGHDYAVAHGFIPSVLTT